ncbi:hypothetical protein BDP27DRAFT_1333036 [Rhodocollybia butyracea]|uniref:Uncharacterized protein n=1 Tax=Rhodocollybia butyracea TaxID=206335 RepID=A0A9P5PK68_9AGAR|nr:hypothetical protein BDP27DRAFT_1333036 [Rhodocollybia butyracea]
MPLFAKHLESLVIQATNKEIEYRWLMLPKGYPPLLFPLLRVLQYELLEPILRFVTAHWKFPVLDTLATFIVPRDQTNKNIIYIHTDEDKDKEYIEASVGFLNAHGKRLKTLLLDWPKGPFDTTAAQEAIAALSHLRHLIIPPFLDICAPQVHWLDCFRKNDGVPNERLVLYSDHDRNIRFPNLQSYRVLDSELVRKLPLLPTLLPPTTEECRFTFPGVDIRCDTSALWGWSTLARDKDELDYSSGGSDWEVASDSDSSGESGLDDEDYSWGEEEELNALMYIR